MGRLDVALKVAAAPHLDPLLPLLPSRKALNGSKGNRLFNDEEVNH
jgi:hypothetical protein